MRDKRAPPVTEKRAATTAAVAKASPADPPRSLGQSPDEAPAGPSIATVAAMGAPASPSSPRAEPGSEGVQGAAVRASGATAASAAAAAAPSLLAPGEQPPPAYRTKLPASVNLHYQVRRGVLRGSGEIRWHAGENGYRLVLEASVAGLTLLTQTSEGAIDAHGLAPVRFLDRRARRPAQAANFRADLATITFSGSGAEWPLLPGSQDRLSWMIQLAGIAAADPHLIVEGGRIAMVVVGARGDAGIWTLRSLGRESVETARGPVAAIKLEREGRSAYDTSAEIWLDPVRSYLPVHAILRNSSGAVEYELLLERIDPAP